MGKLANRAKMTVSGTPGTGTITLASAAAGYMTFAAAGIKDGDLVSYVIEDGSTSFELGQGIYTASGTTLARTSIIASSNSGAAISASSSSLVYIDSFAADCGTGTVSPFLGQVATRCYVPLALGGGIQSISRTAHKATDAVTSIQVVYGNWAVLMPSGSPYTSPAASTDNGPEQAAANNLTIKVYLEKFNVATGSSTFSQILWGGAGTWTFTGGTASSKLSDALSVTLAAGEIFYLRVLATSAGSSGQNNLPLMNCNAGSALMTGPLLTYIDPNNANYSVAEGYEVVTSGSVTDKSASNASGAIGNKVNGTGLSYTLSTDAISGSSGSMPATTFNYYPLAIVSSTTKPSAAICGASVAFGTGDYIGNDSPFSGASGTAGGKGGPAGDIGYIARSIGPYYGYISLAVPSDHVRWMVGLNSSNTTTKGETNYAMRGDLVKYCSHVVMDSGLNDTYADYTASIATTGGLSAPVVFDYLSYFWGMSFFKNKRILQTTVCPITYSTDNWATVANQNLTNPSSPYQNLTTRNAQRTILNDLIRMRAPANVKVVDVANLVENSLNSGIWKVTGAAYGISIDGVHLSANGNAWVAAQGPITPLKIAAAF